MTTPVDPEEGDREHRERIERSVAEQRYIQELSPKPDHVFGFTIGVLLIAYLVAAVVVVVWVFVR